MQKKEITILIIDDEPSIGKALKELLSKDGFTTLLYHHPDHIFQTLKLRPIHAFIIDCMLPKTSGVELAQKIKELIPNPLFIFMSGIYQDKAFIKDTLTKTGGKYFLEKPFSLEKALEIVHEALADKIDPDGKPLEEILYNHAPTPNERQDTILKTEKIHGFDLPRVMHMLMQPQIKGTLNLVSHRKQKSAIHFLNGEIVQVDVHDPKSFFGALLVDKNFITPEEMDSVLKIKSTKKLGERLVEANLISPHVIDIINTEQLALRLSQLVQNTFYDIKFENTEVADKGTRIDKTVLQRFSSDWLSSKLTIEWLKSFYLPLMDKRIVKTPLYSDIAPIYNLYPFNRMPMFAQTIASGLSIEQLFAKNKWDDESLFKAVHLLVLAEFIAFDRAANSQDFEAQLMRLQKIKKDMGSQNYFEVLGLDRKAKGKDVKKNYYELSKIFHPDKLATNVTQEVKDLTNFIFSQISKANEVLSNDQNRENYLKELEHGEAEKVLESESLFDEGKSLLSSNQAAKALVLFEKAMKLRPPTSELRLNYLWAKILVPPPSDIQTHLTSIEYDLNKVPPEDRHNPTYYFIKGLYAKTLGDFEQASRNLRHACSLAPTFKEARRELNLVELHMKNNKGIDIFKADLKDVVGLLFKKKR